MHVKIHERSKCHTVNLYSVASPGMLPLGTHNWILTKLVFGIGITLISLNTNKTNYVTFSITNKA